MSLTLCRACLTENAKVQTIRNTRFQEIYEKLSNSKIVTEDGRPETVCCTCYSQLQQCHNFSVMSQKANDMLTQHYCNGIEITKVDVTLQGTLSVGSLIIANYQENHLLEENVIHIEAIKEECDTVKLESVEIGECFSDNIKLEDDTLLLCNDNASLEVTRNKPLKKKKLESRKYNDIPSYSKEKLYICDMCSKTFASKSNLQSHMKIHIGKRSWACDKCCKKFPNKYELKRHVRSHTGEKPYACIKCHKTYSDSGNLKKHEITHAGGKSYVCTECLASFTLKGNLRRHHKKYHTGDRPVSKLIACNKCGKKFRHDIQLQKHIRTHTGEKYTCGNCNKTFANETYLKAHAKTHSGEITSACDRCGKTFLDKYRLKRHMKSHTGDRPYACELCDRTYKDSGNLKKHVMDHTGEKSHICAICNASFTRKGSLQRHMKCHTGEKAYSCDVCHKLMSTSTHLKRHMRIHTGERPYPCNVCGRAYADNDDCKRHMRIHSGDKSYACNVCNYRSFFKRSLKLHLASKHPPSQRDFS